MIKIKCKVCKKEKYVFPCQIKIGGGKYCGRSCALSDRIVKYETKEKLRLSKLGSKNPMKRKEISIKVSQALKGKHNSIGTEFKKGNIPWCKGIKLSDEHRKKLSYSHRGKRQPLSLETKMKISNANMGNIPTRNGKPMIGENHPFWKGEECLKPIRRRIYLSYRGMRWRKAVLEQDNFICQECGVRGGKLHVHHHIISFATIINTLKSWCDELNLDLYESALKFEPLWDINNGQTLCINCHKQTDSYLKYCSKK